MSYTIEVTTDIKDVEQYVSNSKDFTIIDIETTSLSRYTGDIICVAFLSFYGNSVLVWWTGNLANLDDFKRLKVSNAVLHNAHFDKYFLERKGASISVVWDTMIMAHLLDENHSVGLKNLGSRLFRFSDWSEEQIANLADVPMEQVVKYVAKDVIVTRKLLQWQMAYLKNNIKKSENPLQVMRNIMLPALDPIVKMEDNRLPVDVDAAKNLLKVCLKRISAIERELNSQIPPKDTLPDWLVNTKPKWGNTNWTRWWLYVWNKVPIIDVGKPTKTFPEGSPSLSRETLLKIDHPAANLLIELAQLNKTVNTFLVPLIEKNRDGRVSTSFNITGTVTGRISSSSPGKDNPGINSQQIPRDKKIRNLFKDPDHVWIECDYSQLELRVAAVLAQETTMIDLFKSNEDIHGFMAKKLTGSDSFTKEQRSLAKGVNFGFLYGMHAKHFQNYVRDNYGIIISFEDAEKFREEYFSTFSKLPNWYRKQRSLCLKLGGVPNAFGRFRHLPKVYNEDYWVQENAFRQAINSPVQSTGSDFMLISLAKISKDLLLQDLGAKLITTVHDSVELTAPLDNAEIVAKRVKNIMEQADNSLNRDFLLKADATISLEWGGEVLAEY